jgi:glyoxylase-like metal-dependent hydrolase (beta-lactamase superfamily II)
MIEMFSGRSAQNKELLTGVKLRSPDVVFDTDARIDLGGVTVRLLWFGGAHTKGDELTFVEPDGTLVSGDVVQNKVVPNIYGDGGTPSSWIAVLDKISALHARYVLPDHSAPGDGSLVSKERAFIDDLRTRALALKRQGVSADDAGKQLSEEFKTKHSDWPNTNVAGFVRSVYAE